MRAGRSKQSSSGSGTPRPPTQSVSLDSGKSRLNILRKNIFRKRHKHSEGSKK